MRTSLWIYKKLCKHAFKANFLFRRTSKFTWNISQSLQNGDKSIYQSNNKISSLYQVPNSERKCERWSEKACEYWSLNFRNSCFFSAKFNIEQAQLLLQFAKNDKILSWVSTSMQNTEKSMYFLNPRILPNRFVMTPGIVWIHSSPWPW